VCYAPEPECYAYDFTSKNHGGNVSFGTIIDADKIDALASRAYHDRYRISLCENNFGIRLSITGMFVAEDHFFYRMSIENNTDISYDVDQVRFFVRDQKRSRRTASQEVELLPVKFWSAPGKVAAQSMKSFVVVLPKFTIPDKKNLVVQLIENGGGRHMELKVNNKKLVRPSLLRPLLILK
jgi:conjugative transposon TraN protein